MRLNIFAQLPIYIWIDFVLIFDWFVSGRALSLELAHGEKFAHCLGNSNDKWISFLRKWKNPRLLCFHIPSHDSNWSIVWLFEIESPEALCLCFLCPSLPSSWRCKDRLDMCFFWCHSSKHSSTRLDWQPWSQKLDLIRTN